jgi:hypothetical protein
MSSRATAFKIRIADILSGDYVPGTDISNPTCIRVKGAQISRVNILGTVVDKYESGQAAYASLVLDDGTETIRTKFFGDLLPPAKEMNKGDMALVIGRVKQDERERYVTAEIVKKVADPNYEMLRALEIKSLPIPEAPKPPAPTPPSPVKAAEETEIKEEVEEIVGQKTAKKPRKKKDITKLSAFIDDAGVI